MLYHLFIHKLLELIGGVSCYKRLNIACLFTYNYIINVNVSYTLINTRYGGLQWPIAEYTFANSLFLN